MNHSMQVTLIKQSLLAFDFLLLFQSDHQLPLYISQFIYSFILFHQNLLIVMVYLVQFRDFS